MFAQGGRTHVSDQPLIRYGRDALQPIDVRGRGQGFDVPDGAAGRQNDRCLGQGSA